LYGDIIKVLKITLRSLTQTGIGLSWGFYNQR